MPASPDAHQPSSFKCQLAFLAATVPFTPAEENKLCQPPPCLLVNSEQQTTEQTHRQKAKAAVGLSSESYH